MTAMMKNYLHFTAGDTLLFQTWHPNSSGAIAGACIGLVLVGLLERWLSATRAGLESYWTLALTSHDASEEKCCEDDTASEKSGSAVGRKITRSVPPFIAAHDVSRGTIYAVQALLGYILMLAAMTFEAAYVISIILALGIGEILFGRMNRRNALH
ncbi:Ctr copper transporter [Lentinula edodes]|uniref:Ctr copper transporter n=1 Tax=Lentinula edodes TaxID=5353 RepID=UPI001E8E0FC0|nr:Ctr copper transporter [Lentinula edodes]KAH7880458.1 Ctr copper transporter [Lentinula edodes]